MISKITLPTYSSDRISLTEDELYVDGNLLMYQNKGVLNLYNLSFGHINPCGDILIVGVGFNLLYNNWKDNNNVTSFTGIECDKDIIDLNISIGNNYEYHCLDAFNFTTDKKYDIICLDIFHNKPINYEIKQLDLINHYSKYLKKDGLISYLKIYNIELIK